MSLRAILGPISCPRYECIKTIFTQSGCDTLLDVFLMHQFFSEPGLVEVLSLGKHNEIGRGGELGNFGQANIDKVEKIVPRFARDIIALTSGRQALLKNVASYERVDVL
jgi:hypothetical protein